MTRFPRKRYLIHGLLIVLAAVWALPSVAGAGGIAVIVDEPPGDVRAGEPFEVGLVVRSAHADATPVTDATPLLRFEPVDGTAEPVTVTAQPQGVSGHYVASVSLPTAGRWRWWIQPFGADEPFRTTQPPLEVGTKDAAAPADKVSTAGVREIQARDGQGGNSFAPKTLTVAAGTTVRWSNTGSIPHTITDVDGDFASGALVEGGSFEQTFEQPGTYNYFCEYHGSPNGKGQYGTIVVTAAPQAAAPVAANSDSSIVQQVAALPAEAPAPQQLPALGAATGVGIGLLVAIAAALVGVGMRRRAR